MDYLNRVEDGNIRQKYAITIAMSLCEGVSNSIFEYEGIFRAMVTMAAPVWEKIQYRREEEEAKK